MAFESLRAIVDDLKHSWYFRIYALLWIVCAIVAFSALIVLSHASEENQKNPGYRVWTEFPTKLLFPNFDVFVRSAVEEFTGAQCYYNYGGSDNKTIPTSSCQFGWSQDYCLTVNANTTYATYPTNENIPDIWIRPEALFCLFYTSYNASAAYNNDTDTILGVRIWGDKAPYFAYPGTITDMIVSQMEISQKQRDNGNQRVQYQAQTSVASNWVPNGARFGIMFRFLNFHVTYFEQQDLFNGWMGIGAIGGFAFFLYLLHWGVMALIGMFIANDSKYLGGSDRAKGYDNL